MNHKITLLLFSLFMIILSSCVNNDERRRIEELERQNKELHEQQSRQQAEEINRLKQQNQALQTQARANQGYSNSNQSYSSSNRSTVTVQTRDLNDEWIEIGTVSLINGGDNVVFRDKGQKGTLYYKENGQSCKYKVKYAGTDYTVSTGYWEWDDEIYDAKIGSNLYFILP